MGVHTAAPAGRGAGLLLMACAAALLLMVQPSEGQSSPSPLTYPGTPTYPCNCMGTWEHERMIYSGCVKIPGTNNGGPWCRINSTACARIWPRSWKHCSLSNNIDPQDPYPAASPSPTNISPGAPTTTPASPSPQANPPQPPPSSPVIATPADLCPADLTAGDIFMLSPAASNGTVRLDAPADGQTIVVFCSVGSHCRQGMVFTLTAAESADPPRAPVDTPVLWRIPGGVAYPDLSLPSGDSATISWRTGVHDVHAYLLPAPSPAPPPAPAPAPGGSGNESASLPPATVMCPGRGQVDGTTELAPIGVSGFVYLGATDVPIRGTVYVYCSVGTHCAEGMIFRVSNQGSAPPDHQFQQTLIDPWAIPTPPYVYPDVALFEGDSVVIKWPSGAHDVRMFLAA
ncbi:hypothetical protein FOA52_006222 [Chlamydomonas sp. UWO 241]|nr:hypothetical protein FOA52_006222 [Chlamydomonas sp. UWO 241]